MNLVQSLQYLLILGDDELIIGAGMKIYITDILIQSKKTIFFMYHINKLYLLL